MNCPDAKQLLHAYVDDELDVATAGQLNAHLIECGHCVRAFEAAKSVKIAVGNPALYYKAPADLRNRIVAAFPRTQTPEPLSRPASRWSTPSVRRAMAFAASFLIIFGTTFAVMTRERSGRSDELAMLDLHLRSMQLPDHLTDVVSTDQHTVKPWFDGKLDFAPPVWQLADKGFPLIGGRLESIHNQPAAALVYRHSLHVINLFVWPGTTPSSGGTVQGYNYVRWSAGGMTFWAVSDVNMNDLEKFAETFRSQP